MDIIFVDAKDKSQLPTTDLHIHAMKEHGNYHENYRIVDQTSFNSFVKVNGTFGEFFAKDYYMYTIPRKFSRELTPSSYHKHYFPSESAIQAICKGKFLVVSPTFRTQLEKKHCFNVVTENGALVVDNSSDESMITDNHNASSYISPFVTPNDKNDKADDENHSDFPDT